MLSCHKLSIFWNSPKTNSRADIMPPREQAHGLAPQRPWRTPPPPELEGQLHWTNLLSQCSVPLRGDSCVLSGQADIHWVPSQPCSPNGLPFLGISLSVNQLIHFPWFPRSSSLSPRPRLIEITITHLLSSRVSGMRQQASVWSPPSIYV